MTRSYDAWSNFDPDVTKAIRQGIKTGDWSALEPEIAEALRAGTQYDDWRQFDEATAVALRAAIGQDQINTQIEEDRALAADFRRLAAEYPDFAANQQAVMEYAVKNEIANPEIAFKAWTSHTGRMQSTAPTAAQAPDAKTSGKIEKIEARLEELKYRDDMAANRERIGLKQDLEEARDDGGKTLFRQNDPDDGYLTEKIGEFNAALDTRNRSRATRTQFGHVERNSPQKTKEMKYAEMDLKALALTRAANVGKQREFLAEYETKEPSRKTREADRHGYDSADTVMHDIVESTNQSNAENNT